MATVYRRGTVWWVRFQWRGTEIRKSARTTSKTVARDYLRKLQNDAARLDRGGKPRRTYDETMNRFIDEHLPTLKPSAAADYLSSARVLTGHWSGLHLDEITQGRIADLVRARKADKISAARIKRNLACASSMFTCAQSWDWADDNPIRKFDKRSLREAPPRQRYLTDEEAAAVVKAAKKSLRDIVRLALGTGMRLGEILALEGRDIDPGKSEITIRDSKTRKARTISMDADAAELCRHINRHGNKLVFSREKGQPLTSYQVSRWFNRIVTKLGLEDVRFHDLRHTYASRRVREGHDLYRIGKQLGHETPATTARYSHLRIDDLHDLH